MTGGDSHMHSFRLGTGAPEPYWCPLKSLDSRPEFGCTVIIEPTVHLVDDDPSFLLALSMLLRASGFRVETYSSATAFLDQSRGDEPGCVIADLRMPEVDGLDLQTALAPMPNALPHPF